MHTVSASGESGLEVGPPFWPLSSSQEEEEEIPSQGFLADL